MNRSTTLEALEARRARARSVSIWALVLALLMLPLLAFLLQPGASGPVDVQIPSELSGLAAGRTLGPGDPHIAGGAVAAFQAKIGTAVRLLALLAAGGILFGLVSRRKRLAKRAFLVFLGLNLFGPVNPSLQLDPPKAVSAANARLLLGVAPGEPLPAKADAPTRFMLAQVAWIEGDRAAAARLAAGLDGGALQSPIEAPFRLQFLQGRPIERSTACTPSGCLPDALRKRLFLLAGLVAALGLAAAGGAFAFSRQLGARCARIAELAAAGRLQRTAAA